MANEIAAGPLKNGRIQLAFFIPITSPVVFDGVPGLLTTYASLPPWAREAWSGQANNQKRNDMNNGDAVVRLDSIPGNETTPQATLLSLAQAMYAVHLATYPGVYADSFTFAGQAFNAS